MYDSKKSMDYNHSSRRSRRGTQRNIITLPRSRIRDDQDRADSIVAELKKFNSTPYCECHATYQDCGYQDCCR